jgi:hypothetical protein
MGPAVVEVAEKERALAPTLAVMAVMALSTPLPMEAPLERVVAVVVVAEQVVYSVVAEQSVLLHRDVVVMAA